MQDILINCWGRKGVAWAAKPILGDGGQVEVILYIRLCDSQPEAFLLLSPTHFYVSWYGNTIPEQALYDVGLLWSAPCDHY